MRKRKSDYILVDGKFTSEENCDESVNYYHKKRKVMD